MKHVAKQIYQEIGSAQHILLIPHPNPDGDTSGSVSSLISWLLPIGKKISTYCDTEVSPKFSYLPHFDLIKNDQSVFDDQTIDLVITCDSGDLGYAGVQTLLPKLKNDVPIINFDHHNTNTFFGKHNMVIIGEASTTAVLYQFFYYNNIAITRDIATALMTGIVTDTDHFTNAGTSKTSLKIASKLVEAGAHIDQIRNNIVKDKTIDGLKLWGTVLSKIKQNKTLGLVYTIISQKDINHHNASESDVEGVANFLNNLNEGKFAMILKEKKDNTVKGSFRTTADDIDVSALAKLFGGGGHKKAAGFTIENPIEDAANFIIEKIELFLKK